MDSGKLREKTNGHQNVTLEFHRQDITRTPHCFPLKGGLKGGIDMVCEKV
jgi:hypothetical protein